MRASQGFVFMYSITDRDSLAEVEPIIQRVQREKDKDKFPCVIVG